MIFGSSSGAARPRVQPIPRPTLMASEPNTAAVFRDRKPRLFNVACFCIGRRSMFNRVQHRRHPLVIHLSRLGASRREAAACPHTRGSPHALTPTAEAAAARP